MFPSLIFSTFVIVSPYILASQKYLIDWSILWFFILLLFSRYVRPSRWRPLQLSALLQVEELQGLFSFFFLFFWLIMYSFRCHIHGMQNFWWHLKFFCIDAGWLQNIDQQCLWYRLSSLALRQINCAGLSLVLLRSVTDFDCIRCSAILFC